MIINRNIIGGMMLAAMMSACSNTDTTDDLSDGPLLDEIHLKADVWHMVEGTRATTYDGGAVNNSFMVFAYEAGTTTIYIEEKQVDYSGGVSTWVGEPQRWPNGNGSLDFFTYMPTSLTNTYCSFDHTPYDAETHPNGYSTGSPRISCTSLPVAFTNNADDTQEFVYAYTANQSKAIQDATGGVTMTFKHPFARIYFKLSASHPDITINSITFKSLKNNGTCTFDGTTTTWTPSGSTVDLVAQYTGEYAIFNSNPNSPRSIGGPFLVIPQTWAGDIEVNATWSVWGVPSTQTVSATIPTTWQPGYSYTYTFTINEAELIVNTTRFTEQW